MPHQDAERTVSRRKQKGNSEIPEQAIRSTRYDNQKCRTEDTLPLRRMGGGAESSVTVLQRKYKGSNAACNNYVP